MRFQRQFNTLAEAQQVYKSQLSKERIFIPCEAPPPPQTPVELVLSVLESGGAIRVAASVLQHVDAATAQRYGLGTVGGVLLHMPITDQVKGPLRALLTGQGNAAAKPAPRAAKAPAKELKTEEVEALKQELIDYLEKANNGNHYDSLQLPLDASREQIKANYMALMKRYHPDNYFQRIDAVTQADLEMAYQMVVGAYSVLIHPKKRDKYDIEIGNFRDSAGGSSAEVKRRRKQLEEYKAQNAPRIRQAKGLWDEATKAEKQGNYADAISKLKLAMTFDPQNPLFPRKLRDLQAKL